MCVTCTVSPSWTSTERHLSRAAHSAHSPQGCCLHVQWEEGLRGLSNPGREAPGSQLPFRRPQWSGRHFPLAFWHLLSIVPCAQPVHSGCPPGVLPGSCLALPSKVSFPPLGATTPGVGSPVAQDNNHGFIFLGAFVFSGLFLSRMRSQRPKFFPSLLPLGRPRDAVTAASCPPQVGAG